MKTNVRLIHWHAAEARARAQSLEALGYAVAAGLPPWPVLARQLRETPPAAIVISLDRLPSQGRDVGLLLRRQRATRDVPLVFVGGPPAKIGPIRATLPGAPFTSWRKLGPALAQALAHPRPAAPSDPAGVMAGYAGTPLPKTLGIKPGMTVTLLGAPADFEATLGELPDGVHLTGKVTVRTSLVLWFVHTHREFDHGFSRAVAMGAELPLWIISPKKGGLFASDLSQSYIRAECLAGGLVDYKVCAIDDAWCGLLFCRRGAAAAPRRA